MTLCCFFPCHLSSLHSPCCPDSLPCCSCWAMALLALACWLLPFACTEREQLALLIRVLQMSPITRVQQTLISLPGISSSPLIRREFLIQTASQHTMFQCSQALPSFWPAFSSLT